MSSKRRKRRGAVEEDIEHEESTSTHILSSDPIMIKETETETEKCDEGGITYRPLKSHYLRKSRITRHSSKNRIFFYFAKTSLLVTLFKEK